nr:MAG: MFS transporter [Thermoproteus sp. AZ2]
MSPRRTIAFIVMLAASFMVAVDATIVVLALPAMMEGLKASLDVVVWAIVVYLLVVTVFSTQLGRLGDLRGRARVFNVGMALFGLGSALAGASTNAAELIAFRAVQALGGAMMTSNTMALISDYFPPERRGWAFGWSSSVWNLGAVVGILAGGLITTYWGWRWDFYVNVPVAAIGFLLGLRYLEDLGERTRRSFDIWGAASIGASLLLFSMAGLEIAALGPTETAFLEAAAGAALLIAFALIETRAPEPIIPKSLIGLKMFTMSSLSLFLQTAANYAVLFLLTMYLQGVRGLNPFQASLWLMPGYLIGAVAASAGGRLADRLDPRLVASTGLTMQIIAYLLYRAVLTTSTPLVYIPIIASVNGVGAALFYSSNGKLVMWEVPRSLYGAASGTSRTFGNIGMIVSFVLAIVVSAAAIPRELAFQIFAGLTSLDPALMEPFIDSLRSAFLASAIIMVIAAALSWARLTHTPRQ